MTDEHNAPVNLTGPLGLKQIYRRDYFTLYRLSEKATSDEEGARLTGKAGALSEAMKLVTNAHFNHESSDQNVFNEVIENLLRLEVESAAKLRSDDLPYTDGYIEGLQLAVTHARGMIR